MRFDKYAKNLAWASSVGLTLVFATVIGLAAGALIDRIFGTRPWFTLIFLILGIIAGFRNIFMSLKILKDTDKDEKK